MNPRDESNKTPLSSEALMRDEWRGKNEQPDTARTPGEQGGCGPDDGETGFNPIAGTMLPPD